MDGTRVALVIANDQYADPGLRRLVAPAQDAAALAEALGDPSIGGFEVTVLQNESAQAIRLAVEDFFADRVPEDLLLLHFSCHGLKNAAGELFLAVEDTKPTRLASTAVAADFVNRQMADSRAQRIALFLDCCYGGAFPRGMVVRAAGEAQVRDAFAGQEGVGGGRGRVIVTASSAMEYAFEGGHLATDASKPTPSVFTGAVVDGLTTGEADRDGDGWVGLTELVGFVTDRVHRVTPNQNPQMWTFGAQGELLIARSRVRRITPTPLAPELLEAMESPLTATRFGVVDYLREQLHGTDLGQAYAAWQALQQMITDDSRKVSETARQAIANAVPRTTPAEVNLDDGIAELQLTGPFIALTASATSAATWLRVEQVGTLIRLTATLLEPGNYETTLLITGPTGEHTIPIHLATPQPTPPPVAEPEPPPVVEPAPPPVAEPAPPPVAEPEPGAVPEPAPVARPSARLAAVRAAAAARPRLHPGPGPQPEAQPEAAPDPTRPPTPERPIQSVKETPTSALTDQSAGYHVPVQLPKATSGGAVPWWVVVALTAGALLLVIVNWPGPVDTNQIWYDSNTGWSVYRSWSDPEIISSIVALLACLALRWSSLPALGVIAGCVASILEDGIMILGGRIASSEVSEWFAATAIAAAMAVVLLIVMRPKGFLPRPANLPAAALVLAGVVLMFISANVEHDDGYAFVDITKFALLEPLVVLALGWLALTAAQPSIRLWLSVTTTTYAVISIVANVPALTVGNSPPAFLAAVIGDLLVVAGIAVASRPTRGSLLPSRS